MGGWDLDIPFWGTQFNSLQMVTLSSFRKDRLLPAPGDKSWFWFIMTMAQSQTISSIMKMMTLPFPCATHALSRVSYIWRWADWTVIQFYPETQNGNSAGDDQKDKKQHGFAPVLPFCFGCWCEAWSFRWQRYFKQDMVSMRMKASLRRV